MRKVSILLLLTVLAVPPVAQAVTRIQASGTSGSSVAIGSPISGGTANSVLYLDSSGNLAQRNPGFTYDGSTLELRANGSANIQEWDSSAGTNLALVNSSGFFNLKNGLHVTGGSFPTTGAGLEVIYTGTVYLQAYDRNAASFKPIYMEGSTVQIVGAITLSGIVSIAAIALTGQSGTPGGLAEGGVYYDTDENQFYGVGPTATTSGIQRFNGDRQAYTSTNANRFQLEGVGSWVDSTDASRKARMIYNIYDTAAREFMRAEASGSAAMLGFFGASAVVRPTSTTDLRQALIDLGLYTTGGASPLNLNGGAFTTSGTAATGNLTVTGSIQVDSVVNDTGLAAGVWTFTRSAETNLDANVTPAEGQYSRVGNTVTVSFSFTADPTTTLVATNFEGTLPVSSNIGATSDISGTCYSGATISEGAEIIGVIANDTFQVQWVPVDVTSQSWSCSASYQII